MIQDTVTLYSSNVISCMADTIVNTPSQESSSAGWAVAVIILLAVIVGGFVWYRSHGVAAAPAPAGTNISVTIPAPTGGATNGTGNNTNQ
jgi:hypothetical protein